MTFEEALGLIRSGIPCRRKAWEPGAHVVLSELDGKPWFDHVDEWNFRNTFKAYPDDLMERDWVRV